MYHKWSGALLLTCLMLMSIFSAQAYSATNTFKGLYRYSSVYKDYLPMTDDTAYFRDLFVAGEVSVTGAANGDTWTASYSRPDGIVGNWDNVTFYSEYEGKSDCFVYPSAFKECGKTSTVIMWPVKVQCQQRGQWGLKFYYKKSDNSEPFNAHGFTLLSQVKGSEITTYRQTDYTDNYDSICYTLQSGKKIETPCTEPNSSPYTITDMGCALTDVAMILSHHGIKADPPTLNTWLIENNGYDPRGSIIKEVVETYAKTNNVTMSLIKSEPTSINHWPGYNTREKLICTYGPIINDIANHDHFVLVYGTNSDGTQFLMENPAGNNTPGIILSSDVIVYGGPEHTYLDRTGLTITVHSPVEVVVTDPLGRRIGYDPITNTQYKEIPDSEYSESAFRGPIDELPKHIEILKPVQGDYKVQLVGITDGEYTMETRSHNTDMENSYSDYRLGKWHVSEIPISNGETHMYGFYYEKYNSTALEFHAMDGNFDGKGQRPSDVNKFLSYVTPTTSPVTVPGGVDKYGMVIVYDKSIKADTFVAALDGIDVTSLFHPKPGGIEFVTLNLLPGRNTLVLSIDGSLSNRTATDTDRLVFNVQ